MRFCATYSDIQTFCSVDILWQYPLYFSATLCWIQIMQTLTQRNASNIHSISCLWNHHSVKLQRQMEQLILPTQQPSVMGQSHNRATSHGQYVVSITRNQVPTFRDIHLIYSQSKRTKKDLLHLCQNKLGPL